MKRRSDSDPAVGLGILGGLAASGLYYYLFGPRCRRCWALLPPGAVRCGGCGRKVRG
jgi:hypothetical protein